MLWLRMIVSLVIAGGILAIPAEGRTAEFVVYSVYKALDMGNPGEVPQKDFYVNMGTSNGVREGTVLEVSRRVSTYDLLTEKLYRDVTFPIARIKIIHAEGNAAIARLEKLGAPEKTPAVAVRSVMVGDIVKVAQ